MLADRRSDALASRFAAQWLRLQDLEKINPDVRFYPDFDDQLKSSMLRETELFFESHHFPVPFLAILWLTKNIQLQFVELVGAEQTAVMLTIGTALYAVGRAEASIFQRQVFIGHQGPRERRGGKQKSEV